MFLPTMSLRQQARAKHREPNQMRHAALANRQQRQREMEERKHLQDEMCEHERLSAEKDECSTSINASTSSIDIPGSIQKRAGIVGAAVAHAPIAQDQSAHAPSAKISPKTTRMEMLTKELPVKLMDSINNENKLFFTKGGKAPAGGSDTSTPDHTGNEETSDTEAEETEQPNIIADGIMGNKLKLVAGTAKGDRQSAAIRSKVIPPGPAVPADKGYLLFNDDGFVDDRMIQFKANKNGMPGKREKWEEDNLNYHARGW